MSEELKTTAPRLNVDAAEIAKFDADASRWWDKNSEYKSLHDINPLRLNYMEAQVRLAGLKVLDVGCGGGILSEGLVHRGAHVTGIDMAAGPLQVAKLHGLESGVEINYQQTTVEEFAQQHPGEFDVVCCMEMLEHVPDPDSVIASMATLLKPNGQLFLSTINRNPKAYAMMILAAEYIMKMVKTGTHDYAKFIKPAELAHSLRSHGLELNDISGMTYNAITKHYKIAKNVDVNYFMHAHKPADTQPLTQPSELN